MGSYQVSDGNLSFTDLCWVGKFHCRLAVDGSEFNYPAHCSHNLSVSVAGELLCSPLHNRCCLHFQESREQWVQLCLLQGDALIWQTSVVYCVIFDKFVEVNSVPQVGASYLAEKVKELGE